MKNIKKMIIQCYYYNILNTIGILHNNIYYYLWKEEKKANEVFFSSLCCCCHTNSII